MQSIWDIHFVLADIMGYKLSLVELVGTIFGLAAVWLAARSNILTWPLTLVNTVAFFVIFYQVHLYSDMLLQVYFFVVACYGWFYWRKSSVDGTSKNVKRLSRNGQIKVAVLALVLTGLWGTLMLNIHKLLPSLFHEPASFPYINAFTAILSVIANFLLARRYIENWLIWILVDAIVVVVYAINGVYLISLEYAILLVICIYGYRSWVREFFLDSEKERTAV